MTCHALDAQFSLAVGRGSSRFTVDAALTLEHGVLVLFGPSGSGKSLTLQAIAGILRPLDGHIRVRGQSLFDAATRTHVPAHRRRIGYVPQHASLFPFRSVADNVAFGLPRRARRKGNRDVVQLLHELGIDHLAEARPTDLSGGERQRVALARALIVRPHLLLLDEPFASIDHTGRRALRDVLVATLNAHGTPAVFVTHDPEEARQLGTRIARFARGRTLGIESPQQFRARARVRVTGRTEGRMESLADGRRRLTVTEATVDAPSELLDPCNGTIDLRLVYDGNAAQGQDTSDDGDHA